MRTDAVTRERVWLVMFLVAMPVLGHGQTAVDPAGAVSGVVRSSTTGEAVLGARIEVIGHGAAARTGQDGTFVVRLPPGTYTIRISADGYAGRTIPKLVIEDGKTARVEVKLGQAVKADKDSVIVNVLARLRRAAESAQLARRKNAAVVGETISSEVMKKSAGSDATAAVQRATGVTIREGGGSKTVFVRGLGERYTSALLNGSRLPSPDALKRAVPLDLFPADFLEGIDIVKGFTPDLPGDFAGGLVDMRLRDYPDQLTYGFGLSTGGNTQTTGQDFLTYDGGVPADYFGFGETARNPPSSVPAFNLDELPDGQRLAIGRQFKNVWSPELADAPIDWGGNFQVGNSFGPAGFQLGGVYNARWRTIRDEIRRQFTNAGTIEKPDITVRDDFKSSKGTFSTRLGGVFTGAWRPLDAHTLSVRAFINRNSSDETRADRGIDFGDNAVRQSRLRYVEDELAFGQLSGEHKLDFLFVDWRTVFARTTRDEPDTRHVSYIRDKDAPPDAPFSYDDQQLGGTRISNETREDLSDSALDLTIPFTTALPATDVWDGLPGKLKFGSAYAFRDRTFRQRRFEFTADGGGIDTTQRPEDILDPDNIGPGGIDVNETSLPTDQFKGTHEIIGGYGMLELPLVKDTLRIIGGARTEYSLIRMNSFVLSTELCGRESLCFRQFRKKDFNVLPGVNLIYNPAKDMNVRLSWSQSVSRPELREIAPVDFPAQRGERASIGNPDLEQFDITSYDARWEWFFSPLEVASVGFFYKQLDRPIERLTILRGADPLDTFANSKSGIVYGVEIEGRKDFGFIRPALKMLSASLNVTWSDSEVDVGRPTVFGIPTFPTSPMRTSIGQSPLIVNAAVEYANPDWLTARLSYLTTDRAIDQAGTQGIPDIFEERRDRLDFVLIVPLKRWLGVPLSTKLSVENILNDQAVYTQGGFVQRRFTEGVSFGFGLSYAN